jgi:hypothetical protein
MIMNGSLRPNNSSKVLTWNEFTLGPLSTLEGLKGRIIEGDQFVECLTIAHSLKKCKQQRIRSAGIPVELIHAYPATSLY